MLKCKTTRTHYDEMCQIYSYFATLIPRSDRFGTKIELTRMFRTDRNLCQIPLAQIDAFYPMTQPKNPLGNGFDTLSKSQFVSVVKHYLIYHVIGAQPEFTERWEP
jgi:hypothetical protein